jgi:starch synthase (maltosyl-transferring)
MVHTENDRWTASFVPSAPGSYVFAIEAWTDLFATWRRDYMLKRDAGFDVSLEIREGRDLLARAKLDDPAAAERIVSAAEEVARTGDATTLVSAELADAMWTIEPRSDLAWSELFPVTVDRPRARAGAWYEMFPRSQSPVPGRHGTFDDCIARLPDIAKMGFDVLYFPPIHPIGEINRKGRNNAPQAAPGDPGSPYAIGSAQGGHDAIHPELGTLADFRRLVDACHAHEMEIALDFAVQCAPDHPWLSGHPNWFSRRPDGSIRYAENPPKKYEDIVNPNLYCWDHAALWAALREVVLFWLDQGVRIFRVDNPHTKPFPFWQWLIREVQTRDPGVIFLSEAFTRPKVMKALAKFGFTQSYTYFTWRTTKAELSAYVQELTGHPERDYFRPNFFVNTPDILPMHLQSGEPWIFKARVALAATLSASYGVYSGYELLEHAAISGREEYLNSEKYEIKPRDWDQPGNIKDYIARLNRIRRNNPALLQTQDVRLVAVDNEEVIGFVKESIARDNAVAVAIALADGARQFWFHFGDLPIGPEGTRKPVRAVENLVTGERRHLEWGGVRLRIDPADDPVLLFRCIA